MLQHNTDYYLRVRRVDSQGRSSSWSIRHFKTIQESVIHTPSILPSGYPNELGLPTFLTLSATPYQTTEWEEPLVQAHWQISYNAQFTNILIDTTVSVNPTQLNVEFLDYAQHYYARVKYFSANKESDWSPVHYFMTMAQGQETEKRILKPVVAAPTENYNLWMPAEQFIINPAVLLNFTEAITETHIKLCSDAQGLNVIHSKEYAGQVTEPDMDDFELVLNTDYYLFVRYIVDIQDLYVESGWSHARKFKTTVMPTIQAPSIVSPENEATGVPIEVEVELSPFTVLTGRDVHISTTLQISTDPNFVNDVHTITKTEGDLTRIFIPEEIG